MYRVLGGIAAIVTTAGLLAAPQAAQAATAAPCYGATCVGKSPTICDDPVTVATVDLPGTSIQGPELRWSRKCAANWARGQIDGVVYEYWVETTDGVKASAWSDIAPYYTLMVNGQLQAKVCVRFASAKACSGWK